jgi:hypothetical protein
MPIAEQITSYTSWVAQTSYLDYTRPEHPLVPFASCRS